MALALMQFFMQSNMPMGKTWVRLKKCILFIHLYIIYYIVVTADMRFQMKKIHLTVSNSTEMIIQNSLTFSLTRVQQFSHAQVADGEPHDGGFVQVRGDIVGQGQLVCKLVKYLRLLASATSGSIPWLLLPALRAHPEKTRRKIF